MMKQDNSMTSFSTAGSTICK